MAVKDEAKDYDSADGRSTAGSGKKRPWHGAHEENGSQGKAGVPPWPASKCVSPRRVAHGKRSTWPGLIWSGLVSWSLLRSKIFM